MIHAMTDSAPDDGARPTGEAGGISLLSVNEAAAALRIGRSKLYDLIAVGEIEVVHIGRCTRVPASSVRDFVERHRHNQRAG